MASLKTQLQNDYNRLVKKTNHLTEKMNSIYQQSTQLSIQHTGSDAVIDKVTHTVADIQSYLSLINGVWRHLEQRWKERDLQVLDSSSGDEMMKNIIDWQDDSGDLTAGTLSSSNGMTTTMAQQQQQQEDDNTYCGTNDSGSREYKNGSDTDTEADDNPMESTIKKAALKDTSDEKLVQRLFFYESLVRTSLATIVDEKRNGMVNFFTCLQTISFLEESIANLFLSLRHLGSDIKQLGQRTAQLETVSKGVIEGYVSKTIGEKTGHVVCIIPRAQMCLLMTHSLMLSSYPYH
jgi:hypothetical protein